MGSVPICFRSTWSSVLARGPLKRARIIVWKVGERRRWSTTSGGVWRSIRGGGPVQVAANIKVFVGTGTHFPLRYGCFKGGNPVRGDLGPDGTITWWRRVRPPYDDKEPKLAKERSTERQAQHHNECTLSTISEEHKVSRRSHGRKPTGSQGTTSSAGHTRLSIRRSS
jgi:hypothetical protein